MDHPVTASDVWALPADGDRKPRAVVTTPFSESSPRLSPDGRWLAYTSNEPGRAEVFVQPFAGPGGRSQISTDGGSEPVWSRDGRELFYLNGDRMMAVEITTAPAFRAGAPRLLFEGRYTTRFATAWLAMTSRPTASASSASNRCIPIPRRTRSTSC